VSPYTIADLNKLPHNKALALGQSLKIPAGANNSVAQSDAPQQEDANAGDASSPQVASAEVPVKKPGALTLPKETPTEPVATVATPIDAGSNLALRWPLRGKVISGFGAKPNGLKNEGINIAVPEGTNIQAAEGGVVAYAGNELKGYGNLVLVRHAGGYVTAYAHASQLLVKRGDTVKRGDVIAKAGQTGAVQSPQLHFEVRKGATALDPNKFLTLTASN
jgi:murein DD-endopeptidase MepM/ murein hydrolase activator NlpD